MDTFFTANQIIGDLYEGPEGSRAHRAKTEVPFVKDCIARDAISSSDCRLSISKLITAQAHTMIPRMVDNLDRCLVKRNYPEGYEVDYYFPPVGCAKESSAILAAHHLFWQSRHKQQQK